MKSQWDQPNLWIQPDAALSHAISARMPAWEAPPVFVILGAMGVFRTLAEAKPGMKQE